MDLFKALKLDDWYMAFVYVGGLILIFSLFVPTQWIANKYAVLFSAGTFLIGIGEWKNHKHLSWLKEANAFTGPAAVMKVKRRMPDFIGILFDISGGALIFFALVDISRNI